MWPFTKPKAEVRQTAPYTDALVAAIAEAASGKVIASADATAALEAASGLLGRVLASAKVEGPPLVSSACTADFLQLVGRELLRRGEAVFLIDAGPGGLTLTPAASWDIAGDADPASWWIRCDLFGPSGNTTRTVPHERVLHFRHAVDAARPWQGLSPLAVARLTGRLHAETESALADESAGPRGHLIATPPFEHDANDDDAPDATAALRAAIAGLKGKAAIVESGTWGRDETDRPRSDYVPRRIGANPPDALASLRSDTASAILGACGIPPALFDARADGTAQREAVRRLFAGTVQPMARKVEQELSAKLDGEIRLRFEAAAFADYLGRANIATKLAAIEGISPDLAMALAGLGDE